MIVLDASAAVLALLNAGEARRLVVGEAIVVPHLADSEVTQALRAQVRRGAIGEHEAVRVLETWTLLGIRRLPITGLMKRIWVMRENLSAYDASYVVLAEAHECPLVTADARLAASPGLRCPVTVVSS